LNKRVERGTSVAPGSILFDLVDLSSVWAVFEAYEADLPYLKTGDPITYTATALPGQTFSGKIAFISPTVDKATRTAQIRVETPNPHQYLKPEMLVRGRVQSAWAAHDTVLAVPQSAVLWTGPRSLVYVREPGVAQPVFRGRTVELGPSLGDNQVILSGLEAGEEIVVSGTFVVDAAAQLAGKPSMMHPRDAVEQVSFTVRGACGMCKARIEETALAVPGVSEAFWEASAQQLHLDLASSHISAQAVSRAVSQAIAAVGHDTEWDLAPDAVYEELPGCCLYRE
jgi:Cu(I)/Ag(I) efflux system membrane fusion protein